MISETKFGESFPLGQFKINGFNAPLGSIAIQKLHKAAKRLQYNWEFMNKIELKI